MTRRQLLAGTVAAGAWAGLAWSVRRQSDAKGLLHASFDATRDLLRVLNEKHLWQTGTPVRVSHGGSSKQALAVREGLPADVVSLAVWPDAQELARHGLIASDWEARFPNRSSPFNSTIVFVVRKGNPHNIRDWPDLLKPGLRILAANPKISGAAKLAYIAGWGAVKKDSGDAAADRFIATLFHPDRMPTLESSSRAATQTFVHKRIGDVHLTWESEAMLESRELAEKVEIVRPRWSVRARPMMAVVNAQVGDRTIATVVEKYVNFFYSQDSQRDIATAGFRCIDRLILRDHAFQYGGMELYDVEDVVPGGWAEAQRRFFAENGLFDESYRAN